MATRWLTALMLMMSLALRAQLLPEEVKVNVLSLLKPVRIEVRTIGTVALAAGGGTSTTEAVSRDAPIIIELVSAETLKISFAEKTLRVERLRILPAPGQPVDIKVLARNQFRRSYSGSFSILPDSGTLRLILTKPLESFVRSAALSEFGLKPGSEEAYLAGVVCIRSFVVHHILRNGPAHEFDDHTGDVFFMGQDQPLTDLEHAELQQRLNEIEGIVLVHGNKVVPGYFSSSCGGKTFDIENVWGESGMSGVITGVNCPWCREAAEIDWLRTLERAPLLTALGLEPGLHQNARLVVDNDEHCLRVLVHASEIRRLRLEQARILIGRSSGWNTLPSNNFTIVSRGSAVVIAGSGKGHGVGLCQLGAQEQARLGFSYSQIINYYFPECGLFKLE